MVDEGETERRGELGGEKTRARDPYAQSGVAKGNYCRVKGPDTECWS